MTMTDARTDPFDDEFRVLLRMAAWFDPGPAAEAVAEASGMKLVEPEPPAWLRDPLDFDGRLPEGDEYA
jgi:hypothetical protein